MASLYGFDYDAVAMGDVLIWDSTERSPELRHELPIGIGDPFLYVERDGVRHVVIGSLEIPRVEELDAVEVHAPEEYGSDDLVRSGMTRDEALLEVAARACTALGVASAAVPATFPLHVADRLRAEGIELAPQHELFDLRRRAKTPAELAGIRRAQAAAEARDVGGGRAAPRRRAAHLRADQGRDRRRVHGPRLQLRRVHRLARRAVGDRARHGRRPDRSRASRS